MFLVDSHCHLDMLIDEVHADVEPFVARAQANGVGHILNVCVKMANFPQVLATAKQFDFVSASVGLHPNNTEETVDEETLVRLGSDPKVVALGETGLDYFRTQGDKQWQQERFQMHIRAARRLHKPLIIHTREAKEDTLRIMREENAGEIGGVMHCFTEDWDFAKQALDLNFVISFSGIVTFKNAQTIQDAARHVPLNKMLIETDAPYLAPNPFRGKPNEPSYIRHTAEFLAQLRDIKLENFAEQTTENFFQTFKGALRV